MHNVWRLIFSVHSYTVRVLELCVTAYTIDNESSSISVLCVSHACAHPIPLEAAFRAAAQARVILAHTYTVCMHPCTETYSIAGIIGGVLNLAVWRFLENQPNLIPHQI